MTFFASKHGSNLLNLFTIFDLSDLYVSWTLKRKQFVFSGSFSVTRIFNTSY